jgi:hypothetical protein
LTLLERRSEPILLEQRIAARLADGGCLSWLLSHPPGFLNVKRAKAEQ